MSINFTMVILIFTKTITTVRNVRNEEERGRDYKQFEIIDKEAKNQNELKKKRPGQKT